MGDRHSGGEAKAHAVRARNGIVLRCVSAELNAGAPALIRWWVLCLPVWGRELGNAVDLRQFAIDAWLWLNY